MLQLQGTSMSEKAIKQKSAINKIGKQLLLLLCNKGSQKESRS